MRKTMFSIVTVLAIVSCASAQSPDELVRNSTVAPDLHNSAGGWKVFPEREQVVQHGNLAMNLSIEFYENSKDGMIAFLYVKDAKENTREEIGMLFGSPDVARGAIKSGGVWYVSKDLYFDNGVGNPKGTVSWSFTYDEKDKTKPVKVKLSLETKEGLKEVTVDIHE